MGWFADFELRLFDHCLHRFGYEGTIKCRTKEGYDEGEATFYKTDRFVLESSKGVSLTEVAQKVFLNNSSIEF